MAISRRTAKFSTRFDNVTKSWVTFVYWAIRNLLEPYEIELDYNVITGDVNLLLIKDTYKNVTYKIPKKGFKYAEIDDRTMGAILAVHWVMPDKTQKPTIDFLTDMEVYPEKEYTAEFSEITVISAGMARRKSDLKNPKIAKKDAYDWAGTWEGDFEYCRSIGGPGVKPIKHKELNSFDDVYDPPPTKDDLKNYNKLVHGSKLYGDKMDWDSEFYNDKYADKRNPKNWPKTDIDLKF